MKEEGRHFHLPISHERNSVCYLFTSNIGDYRNWRTENNPENINHVTKDKINDGLDLLMRKGVYPYKWVDDEEE